MLKVAVTTAAVAKTTNLLEYEEGDRTLRSAHLALCGGPFEKMRPTARVYCSYPEYDRRTNSSKYDMPAVTTE